MVTARRVLFYARGALGLGQMRRISALCHGLRLRQPAIAQLVVTGSVVPNHFPLPDGVDYIRMPALTLLGPSRLVPRSLPIPEEAVRRLRRDLLWAAVQDFEPDVLVVDSFPDDVEVLSVLGRLRNEPRRPSAILGLRDIVADAAAVRQTWDRAGVYEALDHLYDRILVFGCRELFDVIQEYGLAAPAAAKTRFTGYLRRERDSGTRAEVRSDLGLGERRLVLVAAGGGQDGFPLLDATLNALSPSGHPARFDTLLVGGPLMPAELCRDLAARVPPGSSVRFLPAVGDLAPYVAAADVVVAMAGYNTVCEILSFERPAILVPRVAPVKEQLVRAEMLSRHGVVRMLRPDELGADRLLHAIDELLACPSALSPPPTLTGVTEVAAQIEAVDPA